MKKRMLKIISIALALVMVFSCASAGAAALGEDGTPVEALKGYFAFDVMVNEAQSKAALALYDEENDVISFGITSNGTQYEFIDFSKYVATGSDWWQVTDYTVMGNDFLFLLQSYYEKEVYSEESGGYEYEYRLLDTSIISTKNGKLITRIKVNLDKNENMGSDDYYYGAFGLFDVVGEELVFANLDYELKEYDQSGRYYASGVYHSTKDLTNWTAAETETYLKYDSKSNYYCTAYKNINGNLLRENWRICDDDKYEREIIMEEVYFKNHKIFDASNEAQYTSVYALYGVLNDVPDTVFRFESVLPEEYYKGTDDGYVRIVKCDIAKNTEEELWKSESDFSWDVINTEDAIYFLTDDENEGSKIYRFDEDMVLEPVRIDNEKFEIRFAYELQEKAFVVTDEEVYIIDETKIEKYRVSQYVRDTGFILAFKLSDNLVIVETPENATPKAYISAQPRIQTGDIDGDGKVISSDALYVLQFSTGLRELSNEQKTVADVNGNGEINSADALSILQYATGLITSFE